MSAFSSFFKVIYNSCVSHHDGASLICWPFDIHMYDIHVFLEMDHGLPCVDPEEFFVEISWNNLEMGICNLDYEHFGHEAFVWPCFQNEFHSKYD